MQERAVYTFIIFLISGINLVLGVLVATRARNQRGSRAFVFLALMVFEWSLAHGLLMLVPAASPWKVRFANLQYIGAALAPVAFLLYVLEYVSDRAQRGGRLLLLLFVEPLVFNLLIWTDQFHHLYRRVISIEYVSGFELLSVDFGPLYWIHVVFSYSILLIATLLLIRMAIGSRGTSLSRSLLLITACAGPWATSVLDVLGVNPTPIAVTHFGFLLMGVALFVNVVGFRLFLMGPRTVARAIVDSMSELVLVTDKTGVVMRANPASLSLLGIDEPDITSSRIDRFLVSPSWAELSSVATKELSQGNATARVEVSIADGLGNLVPVLLTVTAFADASRAIGGYLLVGQDLTDRKLIEEERRKSERLDAIRGLAGGVAHDFNNIMTAASLNAGYLQAELKGNALSSNVDAIALSIQRASDQANKLLLFSGHFDLCPQPCDLNTLLAEFQKAADTDETVEVGPAAGPLIVSVDHELMRRVLSLLVRRVADSSGEPGSVLMEVRRDDAAGTAVIMVGSSHAKRYKSTSHDGAHGEPYGRTESSIDTNLDESVAHSVVARHGGRVEALRADDGASGYRIELPLHNPEQ